MGGRGRSDGLPRRTPRTDSHRRGAIVVQGPLEAWGELRQLGLSQGVVDCRPRQFSTGPLPVGRRRLLYEHVESPDGGGSLHLSLLEKSGAFGRVDEIVDDVAGAKILRIGPRSLAVAIGGHAQGRGVDEEATRLDG